MMRNYPTFCEAAGITISIHTQDVFEDVEEKKRVRPSSSDLSNPSGLADLFDKRAITSDARSGDFEENTVKYCTICSKTLGKEALNFKLAGVENTLLA